jgi:hypothetical protein
VRKRPSSSSHTSVARTVGITGIGIGAVGVAGGGILGSIAILKNKASNDDGHCDAGDHCDAIGSSLRVEAQRYGHASTALFIVGGAILTTGIVLVATSSSAPKEKQPAVRTSLWIGPGSVGLRGHW